MNRQTKRTMQRQGQVESEGTPPVGPRAAQPVARPQTARPAAAHGSGPAAFVKDIRSELRKVAWPTRDEVTNYAVVVLVTLVVLVAFIFALNLAFGKAITALFGT